MSLQSFLFRRGAGRNDRKRDKQIPLSEGITQCRNIIYGPSSKWNRLDVYYPDGTAAPLPTIVSIHGGGYVYGTKENYRRYCMDLAARGFAVVNFTYRLAPKYKFPVPLADTNAVMQWICRNAQTYRLDPQRLFLVGDSAGAQIASQYAAIVTNPDYGMLFNFTVPNVTLRGIGLNCGMYDGAALAGGKRSGVAKDYLGVQLPASDPRLQVLFHIDGRYPPAHITTAHHDFLKDHAEPMERLLRQRGVKTQLTCYGRPQDSSIGHVFHLDLRKPEAKQCNDDQCDFFKSLL